jgi:hypothetical protein
MKLNSKSQAGTKSDSSTKDEATSVSQHSSKPHVVCSPKSLSPKQILENRIKIYEWFYGQLESLIKSTNLALNRSDGSITYVGNIKLESVNTSKKKGKGNRLSSVSQPKR